MMRVSCVLALVLSFACGGGDAEEDVTEIGTTGGEVEPPPPPPLDPLALMPVDSLTVTTFEVGRLRTSPYYPTVHGWLELISEISPRQREAIDVALASTELAHVSLVNQPCATKCWTLASIFLASSMDASAANAALQQAVEDETFAPREVVGLPAFGNSQGAMVNVEPGKYLLGPFQYIEPPLQQPERPRAETNAAVASAMQALAGGDAMIRGWVVGDATTQSLLARETPFSARLTSMVLGAAYRAELSNGLVLDVVATTADPASASTLADALRSEIDALTSGLPARAMGIRVLGEATTVRVVGNQAHLTLQLSDEQLRPLLRRVDGLLRLVN